MWRTPYYEAKVQAPHIPMLRKECDKWNEVLQSRMANFTDSNPDCTASFLDVQPAFLEVLDHAEDYGAPNGVCQKKQDQSCLWNDNLHPGQEIQKSIMRTVKAHLRSTGFFP